MVVIYRYLCASLFIVESALHLASKLKSQSLVISLMQRKRKRKLRHKGTGIPAVVIKSSVLV